MNELTIVLCITTLIATKLDLPEYNKLKLQSVSIAQNRQLWIHGCYLEFPTSYGVSVGYTKPSVESIFERYVKLLTCSHGSAQRHAVRCN